MKKLTEAILELEEIKELVGAIEYGACPAAMTGLAPVHRAHLCAALRLSRGGSIVIVCTDEGECVRIARDIESLTGEHALLLTGRELHFRASAIASREWEHRRLAALYSIAKNKAGIIVATVDSLMLRTMPKDKLLKSAVTLRADKSYDLTELAKQLAYLGYSRCEQVEGPGQFALRGGILDIFSPGMDLPVRCEFFGDEIDSMGVFEVSTQRRVKNAKTALILPSAEVLPEFASGGREGLADKIEVIRTKNSKKGELLPLCETLAQDAEKLRQGAALSDADKYLCAIYPDAATALDYLPEDAVLCFSESARVGEKAKNFLWQMKEDAEILLTSGIIVGQWAHFSDTVEEMTAKAKDFPVLMLDSLPTSKYPIPPKTLLSATAKQLSSYGGSLEAATADMHHYLDMGYRVVLLCQSNARAAKLSEILREHEISAAISQDEILDGSTVTLMTGALSAGAEYPSVKLAVLTEGQMVQSAKKKQKAVTKDKTNKQKLQSYTDLSPGDLVVHIHHGVGRFLGIFKMPVDGVEKDYIKIAYAGSDSLYVPATQLDMVSKYIGGGDDTEHFRLNKLGGTEWAKTKYKAKAAAKDLAKGLIQLYAERQKQRGFAFSPDSPWQKEFEEAFPYAETDDQLRCIEEIKADMEKPIPMDRLLCGDVGYGKTEVALRAVMKCVLDGKQAAILVPTTVLAQQHYTTAMNRFRAFPVSIAVLSRYQTPKESKKILADLKNGSIDILVGTHRLLQKSIEFKDLGLLVIDEEQRFGVTHKEKLKEMSKQVDALTLTATPIPRTLNMALSGIRAMSVIEMPPSDRQSVQTYVLEHDWSLIADAMRREINRGGQVYYLHNRVETIDRTAARIQEMLGEEVSVVVAHGKLSEHEISEVMRRVIDGEAQVLVCTTIIETGIDIPNVNTMIIEDADRLGLAQLHQLRGRIGRSARRAYAYMSYRKGKILTEIANRRLSAIREYVEFGSGFKIAMRDLEIRGAGNILGPEQSGYMMSVGYDMYLSLLEEAVLEEQGKRKEVSAECSADLSISANIPERYVKSAEQRMDLYRRIAAAHSESDADDLLDELIDRYGEPPKEVYALLDVALLRAAASKGGIEDISQKGEYIRFTFAEPDLAKMSDVCGLTKYKGRLRFVSGDKPCLALKVLRKTDVMRQAQELAEIFAADKSDAAQ